jgi:putative sigma-54 modulation protein
MQIVIQARGFDLSAGMREHVERRLHFALDWAQHHVSRVVRQPVRPQRPTRRRGQALPHGLPLAGLAEVLIDDTESDLYVAIDRAADRAGRTLARRLARQREHRHDSSPARVWTTSAPGRPRDGAAESDAAPRIRRHETFTMWRLHLEVVARHLFRARSGLAGAMASTPAPQGIVSDRIES